MSTSVNVRDVRSSTLNTFNEVECGSWFVDEYGGLYCKLYNRDGENAFSAINGNLEEFGSDEFAQPIKKLTFFLEE